MLLNQFLHGFCPSSFFLFFLSYWNHKYDHRGGITEESRNVYCARPQCADVLLSEAGVCVCVLCDISENSLSLQNSSAELYCTLTDNLSVNVPRRSGGDAFGDLMLLWKLCVWTLGCFTAFHLTTGALQSPCSPNHNDTTPPLELLRWQNRGSFAVTSIKATVRRRWINK